jgi:hypothetical protein
MSKNIYQSMHQFVCLHHLSLRTKAILPVGNICIHIKGEYEKVQCGTWVPVLLSRCGTWVPVLLSQCGTWVPVLQSQMRSYKTCTKTAGVACKKPSLLKSISVKHKLKFAALSCWRLPDSWKIAQATINKCT